MKPATRSASGAAMEAGKGGGKAGSKVGAVVPARIHQQQVATKQVGPPRDQAGRFTKGGSGGSGGLKEAHSALLQVEQVDAAAHGGSVTAMQVLADDREVTAVDLLQDVGDVQVVSASNSSSDVEERVGEPGEMENHGLQQNVGLLADQVVDDMPQSASAAMEGNREPGPAVGAQKGVDIAKKAPWVNLFRDNRNVGKGFKLEEVETGEDVLQIEEDDVDNVEEAWGFCLVGLFAGKFPGAAAVRTIMQGWKARCNHWIHRSGWIVFRFSSEEDRLSVLHGGPYFIYGRSLMLKSMPRCFRFGGEELASVPVWVQLPDLPIDCWNGRALSKIASRLGKPITTDKMTCSKERLSFARVMVEVDVSKDLKSSMEIRLPTGDIYEQLVVYENVPKFCKKCKVFGHNDGECSSILEERNRSAYVPRRTVRPGGAAPSNKGGSSGYRRVAESPLPVSAPVVNVEVPPCQAQAVGKLSGKAVPAPVLLPQGPGLAAEGAAVPALAAVCPAGPAGPSSCADVPEQQQDLLQRCTTVELAGAIRGNRQGYKGRSKKSAGQQSASAVQQQQVKEGPVLHSVEEGASQGPCPISSAGGGVEESAGVGLAPTSSQIEAVGECLETVAAGDVSGSWGKECDPDEGDIRPSVRTAPCALASRNKGKGKGPSSSK